MRAGIYVYGQHDDYLFGVTSPDPDLFVAAAIGGRLGQSRIHLRAGSVQANFVAHPQWRRAPHAFRQHRSLNPVSENAADPRIGAAVRIPGVHWVLRGSYSRYYQAPPLDTVTPALLNGNPGFGFLPLHGERDEEYEAGLAIPFYGWVLDTDYSHNAARNFLDHDVLGNSNIFFPLTIARARIRAWETTLRSPEIEQRRARSTFPIRISTPRAEAPSPADSPISSLPNQGLFFLDHDQRDTLSAGYNIRLPRSIWTSGNLNFGSGFLVGGRFPDICPAHTTFDLSVGKNFGERLSLAFTARQYCQRPFHARYQQHVRRHPFQRAAPDHRTGSLAFPLLMNCAPARAYNKEARRERRCRYRNRNYELGSPLDSSGAGDSARGDSVGPGGVQQETGSAARGSKPSATISSAKSSRLTSDQASIMVDGQEIVGFMSAMTMPYPVRDTKLLAPLGPGDEITADVVVDDNGAYLENIVVTKKGDGKGPYGNLESSASPATKFPTSPWSIRTANESISASIKETSCSSRSSTRAARFPTSARWSRRISRRFTRLCGRIRRSARKFAC